MKSVTDFQGQDCRRQELQAEEDLTILRLGRDKLVQRLCQELVLKVLLIASNSVLVSDSIILSTLRKQCKENGLSSSKPSLWTKIELCFTKKEDSWVKVTILLRFPPITHISS